MPRILVIEDEDIVRSVLQATLEREGYEVAVASDGLEGVTLFTEKPFDLVITDIIMPNKEGLGTIIDIKKQFPDAKVFAISGGGRLSPDNYLDLATRFGAMRTLTKPVEREVLLEAVKEAVGPPLDSPAKH